MSHELFLTKAIFTWTNLGPVVQSIVSLTMSLRGQLVKDMPNKLSNPLLFFVAKM